MLNSFSKKHTPPPFRYLYLFKNTTHKYSNRVLLVQNSGWKNSKIPRKHISVQVVNKRI